MNSIKLHIGIIAFLVIGIVAFYMSKDDVSHYKNVYEATYQIQRSNDILIKSSYYRISELEHVSERYPYLRPLVEYTKEIQSLRGQFYEKIAYTKGKILEIEHLYYRISEENEIQWNENINYPHKDKSKKEAQLIINNFADELAKAYQNFDSSLISLLKDTTGIPSFPQGELSGFQTENIYLRDTTLNLLRSFKDEKTLMNAVSDFDILHCSLFLTSCQQELIIIENKLLNSYYKFALTLKTAFRKPNKYAIIMSPERTPIVGEPFKADFWVTPYVDSDDLVMRVNGTKIPVKDGIGTYNFMPRQSGEFAYKVSIGYKNKYTGRFDNYARTFIIYVP